MADEADPNGAAAPAAQPDPKPDPAPAPDPKPKTSVNDLPDEALTARLDREKRATETKFLQALGVSDLEAAKAKFKRLDELETEKLSDSEKRDKRIAELEPQASRAAELEQRLAVMVEAQFVELSESQRNAIDAVAQGNAEKRLELMQVMKAAGLAQPALPANPTTAPRANTAPPVNPPTPAGTETAWDKFAALSNPIEKQLFYRAHRAEIEEHRPA